MTPPPLATAYEKLGGGKNQNLVDKDIAFV
jgi:hypothetical protein